MTKSTTLDIITENLYKVYSDCGTLSAYITFNKKTFGNVQIETTSPLLGVAATGKKLDLKKSGFYGDIRTLKNMDIYGSMIAQAKKSKCERILVDKDYVTCEATNVQYKPSKDYQPTNRENMIFLLSYVADPILEMDLIMPDMEEEDVDIFNRALNVKTEEELDNMNLPLSVYRLIHLTSRNYQLLQSIDQLSEVAQNFIETKEKDLIKMNPQRTEFKRMSAAVRENKISQSYFDGRAAASVFIIIFGIPMMFTGLLLLAIFPPAGFVILGIVAIAAVVCK